jgi:hypothetical protein
LTLGGWKYKLGCDCSGGSRIWYKGAGEYMANKKDNVDVAAEKIVDLLIDHMEETMTPAEARAMREDLHTLAVS